jgi:NDP-sugar pyrophosphorylase family protein
MKCILLSAGKGERLLPYTKDRPKCLIDLGGTNLMEIWLKKISELNIDEIIVNTHHLSDMMKKEIHRISKKLNMKNIKIFHEKELLGTAGTLWSLKNEINDDFFVINTDVYAEIDLKQMLSTFLYDKIDCLIAYDHRNDTNGCGIIKFTNNSFLNKFIEKNHNNQPGFVYSGILIFTKHIFSILPFSSISNNNYAGLDTGHHVLPKILETTKGYEIVDKVIDLRDENRLLELRDYYKKRI